MRVLETICVWGGTAIIIINIVLVIKVYLLKKGAREIRRGIAEKLNTDTNTLIDISTLDRDIRALSADLNIQLRELRKEKIRCQQGDLELKEAVTNISHDLRTPLTAICGYLNMLEKEKNSPKAQRYLEIISERTDVMRQLTEELLKYSVAVSGEHIPCEPEDVVINNVLEESITGFYAVLTGSGIEPEIDICEEKVHRMLNKNALSRVFSNIISNAVKYSGGDLCISLNTEGRITFSNKAPGLDEITVGRLFDRFYTVENGKGSTGLGLSIARALTEQMGGSINASYINGRVSIEISF